MDYIKRDEAVVVLEDGTVFYGKSVGVKGIRWGEICFNTGMTGYQEVLTDPSYFGQIMLSTTPHVGTYGVTEGEDDSSSIKVAGLVCKDFSFDYSRPVARESLSEWLSKEDVVAIYDVDTRALTAHIRDLGATNAIICTDGTSVEALKAMFVDVPSMEGLELASKVSTEECYFFGNPDAQYKVSILDFGVKTNILRCLAERDCYLKVYPYNSTLEDLLDFSPNGIFLSNGPGDPKALGDLGVLSTVQDIVAQDLPVFGICLGHQLIGLSKGATTFKMLSGHRGVNHPVLNLLTGRGEITSQNHGFALSRESVDDSDSLEVTHVHLNDQTVAGIRVKDKAIFSVQYHPESSPGPHDSRYLFDEFVENMDKFLAK